MYRSPEVHRSPSPNLVDYSSTHILGGELCSQQQQIVSASIFVCGHYSSFSVLNKRSFLSKSQNLNTQNSSNKVIKIKDMQLTIVNLLLNARGVYSNFEGEGAFIIWGVKKRGHLFQNYKFF